MAMHIKTTVTRGGYFHNITFRHNIVYNTTGFLDFEIDYQSQVLPPKDYNATKIDGIVIQDNLGLGSASSASFRCSPDVVCDHVTVQRNAKRQKYMVMFICTSIPSRPQLSAWSARVHGQLLE
jgi:polygalacturonase